MSRAKRLWKVLLLVGLGLSSLPMGEGASSEGRTMDKLRHDDNRLQQVVSVHAAGQQLSQILEDVQTQTHVSVDAAPPLGDIVLALRLRGQLSVLMESLSEFFAADRSHRPHWTRSGGPVRYHYRLERDIATDRVISELRQQREAHYVQRMEGLFELLSGGPGSHDKQERAVLEQAARGVRPGGVLNRVAGLPPTVRRSILLGEKPSFPVAELAGGQDPAVFAGSLVGRAIHRHLTGTIRGEKVDRPLPDFPSGGGTLTFYVSGRGIADRILWARLTGDPASPKEAVSGGARIGDLFPDMGLKGEQERWVNQIGGTTPASAPLRKKDQAPEVKGAVSVTSEALRLADLAGVNLICDDYGYRRPVSGLPPVDTLGAALDRFCSLPGDPQDDAPTGYFWRELGGVYYVRSVTWPEDEPLSVPYRLVKQWRQIKQAQGILGIEELAEMSSLPADSLRILQLWFPEAGPLRGAQAPFRWFYRASTAVRAQMMRPEGVPLADLRPLAEELSAGVDDRRPLGWLARLKQIPLNRLRVSIQIGVSDPKKLVNPPPGSQADVVPHFAAGALFYDTGPPLTWVCTVVIPLSD